MHLDAGELQTFYDRELGQIARRYIRTRLREVWPNVKGMAVLGLGYATPYLRPFQGEAARVIALMPAQQGVAYWPSKAENLAALTDESALPLPDASIDRVVVAHLLETTETLRPLLRQIWRVLTPSGRVVVIAPNRTSLWAQVETTPFGHGRPFSRGQLNRLLTDAMFTPTASTSCLHMPPFGAGFLVRNGVRWERWGQRIWPQLAGVHLMEVTKEIIALAPDRGLRQRVPARPVLVRPSPKATADARQPSEALAKEGANRKIAPSAVKLSQ
ncbi:MAG: class I SAM-dependent methyltransferase [Micropepsaceae bacterium]